MTSASTYYSTFTTRLIFILMSLEFTFISDYEKKNCPRTRWCLIIYRSIRRTDHVLQRDTVTCPRPAPVLRSYSTTQHTQLQHTAVLGIVLPGRPNILDSLHQKSYKKTEYHWISLLKILLLRSSYQLLYILRIFFSRGNPYPVFVGLRMKIEYLSFDFHLNYVYMKHEKQRTSNTTRDWSDIKIKPAFKHKSVIHCFTFASTCNYL